MYKYNFLCMSKSFIYKNPEKFQYDHSRPFESSILIKNLNEIINNVSDNFIKDASEESINFFTSFKENSEVVSYNIGDTLEFNEEELIFTCSEGLKRSISIKTENKALVSLLSLLKISYKSFYKNNNFELNRDLILNSINRVNGTIKFFVKNSKIEYVYSSQECKNIETIQSDVRCTLEIYNNYKVNKVMCDYSDENTFYLILSDKSKSNSFSLKNTYTTGIVLGFNFFTNDISTATYAYNEVSESFIFLNSVQEPSIDLLKEQLSFPLSSQDTESLILDLFLINSLVSKKINSKILKQAIAQQVDLGGFNTVEDFLNILVTFSKQFKLSKHIEVSRVSYLFVTYLISYYTESKNLINQTFYESNFTA